MPATLVRFSSVARTPWFFGPVLVAALLGFGFSATNETVGIDDLERSRYLGLSDPSGFLAAGRWGAALWPRVLGTTSFQPYAEQVIAVLLLVAAAVAFAALFHEASDGRLAPAALTAFASVFVSYPLIAEIWAYSGANVLVAGGYLLVAVAMILISDQESPRYGSRALVALAMLGIVAASYENLLAVFILAGCAVLILRFVYRGGSDRELRPMAHFLGVMVALAAGGVLVRLLVHRILLLVLNLEAGANGATEIAWLDQSLPGTAVGVVRGVGLNYVLMGLWYQPVTLFVATGLLAVVAMIVLAVRFSSRAIILPFLGLMISPFLLSIVQGSATPYRAAQPLALFVAFIVMLALDGVLRTARASWLRGLAIASVVLLVVQQGVFLNGLLSLNHLRSQQEAVAVREMGNRLAADFRDKPVVLVGRYTLSPSVTAPTTIPQDDWRWELAEGILAGRRTRFVQTINNSVIDWSVDAFYENQVSARKLFNYYGFDFVAADPSLRASAAVHARDHMPPWPARGSIEDMGDYVIVNLGSEPR